MALGTAIRVPASPCRAQCLRPIGRSAASIQPHSQPGCGRARQRAWSPGRSLEPRPAPAPTPPPGSGPAPSRELGGSGRRGLAVAPWRAREARAGAPPQHARRARPPAPPPVAIKGRRAERSASSVGCFGSAFIGSYGCLSDPSRQNGEADREQGTRFPGKARARRAASVAGEGEGGRWAGAPPQPGGRGRGALAWDCGKPGPGRA